MDHTQIIDIHNKLLSGVFINEVVDFEDFIFVKSVFDGYHMNNIIPITAMQEYDWYHADNIIHDEKNAGKEVAFYIDHKDLSDEYAEIMDGKGYKKVSTDSFLIKNLTTRKSVQYNYIAVNQNNHKEYLRLSIENFPEYVNERKFCSIILKNNGKKTKSYMVEISGQSVAAGSIIYSSEIGYAYITNVSVDQRFRNMGIQKDMINYICSQCINMGIKIVYSIVEPNSISEGNLIKTDFISDTKYDQFFTI